MSNSTTRSAGSSSRRHVRCYLCGNISEVSAKALSTTCPACHKAIKIEDVVVKNYLPVNDVQTCGTITVTKKGRIAARRIQAGDGVVCDGAMEGKLETAGPVQLGAGASWKGSELFSASLSIEEGATLVGYVAVPCVASPAPLVEPKPLVRRVESDDDTISRNVSDDFREVVDDADSSDLPRAMTSAGSEDAPSPNHKSIDPADSAGAPLPAPKVISTRKAAAARVTGARSSKTTGDKPLPTPRPASTRQPAADPAPPPAEKTTSSRKKTTPASIEIEKKPAAAPRVITTRKPAASRSTKSPRPQSGG